MDDDNWGWRSSRKLFGFCRSASRCGTFELPNPVWNPHSLLGHSWVTTNRNVSEFARFGIEPIIKSDPRKELALSRLGLLRMRIVVRLFVRQFQHSFEYAQQILLRMLQQLLLSRSRML